MKRRDLLKIIGASPAMLAFPALGNDGNYQVIRNTFVSGEYHKGTLFVGCTLTGCTLDSCYVLNCPIVHKCSLRSLRGRATRVSDISWNTITYPYLGDSSIWDELDTKVKLAAPGSGHFDWGAQIWATPTPYKQRAVA